VSSQPRGGFQYLQGISHAVRRAQLDGSCNPVGVRFATGMARLKIPLSDPIGNVGTASPPRGSQPRGEAEIDD
jgi:hypothetical protein